MSRGGRAAIGIGVLAAIGGGVFFAVRAGGNSTHSKWITGKVTKGDIVAQVSATGTLQPVVTSPVGAQVSGIVYKLHADFNSQVKEGQVLVELDPALFKNAVLQAEAQLATSLAGEAKAKAALADAKRAADRQAALVKEHFVAQADADTAQATLEGADAALKGASAQVIQARAALDKARLDMEHSVIRSPVNGTVISRAVDVGQAVAASFTAPTLFTIAQDLTKMQVHANIDEADIGQLKVGDIAVFTVDAFRGQRFRAKVSQVRNAATTIQNVVTYDVVMDVDNSELKLRPGMTANVKIVTAKREGVLGVPNAALRFRPPSEPKASATPHARRRADEKPIVYTPAGDTAQQREIQTGISDGQITEVTSGLAEGDEVILDAVRERDGKAPGGGMGMPAGPPGRRGGF